jgi:hypothetical protein
MRPTLCVLALAACACSVSWAAPSPILVTFDCHADPLNALPLQLRPVVYREWRDAIAWLLDQTDPRGAKVSFCCVGEFAEYCLEDEAGLDLLRRLYRSGGSIGTHNHFECHVGPHDWRNLDPWASPGEVGRLWRDNVDAVDAAVAKVLDTDDPVRIREVNNLRGSHLPSDGRQFQALMKQFGFTIHQAGPGEDFAGLFHHYLFHPYRESAENAMAEDPQSPVILTQAGPVLGANSVHKGIPQDMTRPSVQAKFLMEALNWAHAVARGDSDRVWCFGWAVHAADISPGRGISRNSVKPILDWFDEYFVGRRIGGSVVAKYGSYTEEAAAHLAWEKARPGERVPAYPYRERDWTRYPYLLAPGVYLWDARYVKPIVADERGQAHLLAAGPVLGGPYGVVVALPARAKGFVLDLTDLGESSWMVVDPATGRAQESGPKAQVGREGAILVSARRYLTMQQAMAAIDGAFPRGLPGRG